MNRIFKFFVVLSVAALSLAACKEKENEVVEPVKYTISADTDFNADLKANIKVTASKAAEEDVTVVISRDATSTLPEANVSFPEKIDIKAGDKEASAEVVVLNPVALEPGEYKIVLSAAVGDEALADKVTINYGRPDLKGAWSIIGLIDWNTDIAMEEVEDGWYAAYEVEVEANSEFKFRKDAGWDLAYGLDATAPVAVDGTEFDVNTKGGENTNLKIEAAGFYDIYLNPNKAKAKVEKLPERLLIQKVWGHYGEAGVCGWPGKIDEVKELDGNIRNATMDDDYVYIPKTVSKEAKIFYFSVADGSYQGLVTAATEPAYMAGTYDTFPVSCARVMKNTDSSVNGGKDILMCQNLAEGQSVRLYAWENGINAQPKLLTNFSNPRRWGDRITVTGTYQNGRVWCRSFAADMTAYIVLNKNYTEGFNGSHAWNWVEKLEFQATEDGDNKITEFTAFDANGSFGIVSSESGKGTYLVSGATTEKLYDKLIYCYGWTPFKFGGKDYLAFLNMSNGADKPFVCVLEGATDSKDNLKATLDAFNVVAKAAFATADVDDYTTGTAFATRNLGDCQVRIIDGVPYILGATRGSIAMFKLVLK